MEELLKNDLEEAYFYLYKADLYIKLKVTDVTPGDSGIAVELGEDCNCHLVIWEDSIVNEVDHPKGVTSSFSWCYEIKNNKKELLGYLAA